MEELIVGNTRIPVSVKENARLKKSRLSVDSIGVLVETPSGLDKTLINSVLQQKIEWIFYQWEELKGRRLHSAFPERFVSGAKIMFLGRYEPLTVTKGSDYRIDFGGEGFSITAPDEPNREEIANLVIQFYQGYLGNLLKTLAQQVGYVTDLRFVFTRRRDRWAYCDENRVIHIGWDMAFLPKKLIEYILVHELCHLKHMNHGEPFWSELRGLLPESEELKRQLTKFESEYDF